MNSKERKTLDALTRRVTELDEHSIDELYGLEPVYRPDAAPADRVEPTLFVVVCCPYCAEQYETQVDLSAGSFTYVEDCQICCQPIELFVEVDATGRLHAVIPRRTD
jgi:cysteine-rich CPXCG protein